MKMALDNNVDVSYTAPGLLHVRNRHNGASFITLNVSNPKALVFDVDQDNIPAMSDDSSAVKTKRSKKRKDPEAEGANPVSEPAKKKQRVREEVVIIPDHSAEMATLASVQKLPTTAGTSKKKGVIKTAKVTMLTGVDPEQRNGPGTVYSMLGFE